MSERTMTHMSRHATAERAPSTGTPTAHVDTRILCVRTLRARDDGNDSEYVWPIDKRLVDNAPTGCIIIADGPCQRTGTADRYAGLWARLGVPLRRAPAVLYYRDAHELAGVDEEGQPTRIPVPAGWHVVPVGRWPRADRTWANIEAAISAADALRLEPRR